MSLTSLPAPLVTVLLLTASNLFMTFAWYGHLKFKAMPLWIAIALSWGIALFEYILQVPANRIGYGQLSAAQLKTIQEVISLSIFVIFAWAWLGEAPKWQTLAGFALIAAAPAPTDLPRCHIPQARPAQDPDCRHTFYPMDKTAGAPQKAAWPSLTDARPRT